MSKLMIVLGLSVALCAAGTCLAQEEDAPKLGVTLDSTYVTKYLWRGYDILDGHAAWQPSVELDLFGTGFTFNVWSSIATSGGLSDLNEVDYTLAYGQTLFEDKRYALDVGVQYIYYDFPRLSSKLADAEETGVKLALPALIRTANSALVPSYYVGRLNPAKHGGGHITGGTFQTLGLSYDLPIPRSEGKSQVVSFAADVTHNSGAYDADPDWSHATFGVSTKINIGASGFTVTPALNYQVSMDDTVNDEDEIWAGLSVSYGF